MSRYAIRQEILNLQRENNQIKRKISQCERTINRLNDINENLRESLQQVNNAEGLLEENVIGNKAADKGHASECINNIKKGA